MHNLTSSMVYRFLLPPPWIDKHANTLWNLDRPLSWWQSKLKKIWKAKLPLKQRLFFWRCIVGAFSIGVKLEARRIASSSCSRCSHHRETVPHLLWSCPHSRILITHVSHLLRLRFPSIRFGKLFWMFGCFSSQMSPFLLFFHWARFWVLWTIWTQRLHFRMGQQFPQAYAFFRMSLKQSLYDSYAARDLDATSLEVFSHCF